MGGFERLDEPRMLDAAPLTAVCFLEKSHETKLDPLKNKKEIIVKLLACLVKPLVTVDWMEKMVSLIEEISFNVPCYILKFNKNDTSMDLASRLKYAK